MRDGKQASRLRRKSRRTLIRNDILKHGEEDKTGFTLKSNRTLARFNRREKRGNSLRFVMLIISEGVARALIGLVPSSVFSYDCPKR